MVWVPPVIDSRSATDWPGRSGLDFQRDLAAASVRLPIVTKPFRDQELLDAVNDGLARDRARREDERR
jgi:FixJ family two-component response regulator